MSLLLLLSTLAAAAPSKDVVLAAIQAPSGWSKPTVSRGVEVSTKAIPGIPVPAYRGVRAVDVTCDAYFETVADPNRHKATNKLLRASKVVKTEGDAVVFYQVLDLPILSDRYWINRAVNQRNLGGVQGHHRQTWSAENEGDYPAVRDAVLQEFGAVFTPINYGMWDLAPSGSGCTITYVAVSDPGGSIPSGAGSWASEKSLPDNINAFYEAAK